MSVNVSGKKILLDEDMPDSLALRMRQAGYDATSLHETPWASYKNGALGREIAKSDFDLVITKDQQFHNQSGILAKRPSVSVVVVDSRHLRQAIDATFIPRFMRALTDDPLPDSPGGPHLWPRRNFNNDS